MRGCPILMCSIGLANNAKEVCTIICPKQGMFPWMYRGRNRDTETDKAGLRQSSDPEPVGRIFVPCSLMLSIDLLDSASSSSDWATLSSSLFIASNIIDRDISLFDSRISKPVSIPQRLSVSCCRRAVPQGPQPYICCFFDRKSRSKPTATNVPAATIPMMYGGGDRSRYSCRRISIANRK